MKKIDLDREEPLLVNKRPEGRNNMSSRASFMQKKLYEKNVVANPEFLKNKMLDIWYERILYGRVDQFQNTVQIKQEKLRQIPQDKQTILAADFVTEAFNDFVNYWDFLAKKGSLEKNSPYFSLHLQKGWEDPNKLYYDIMGIYYAKLQDFIKANNKDKSISDFKSFLDIFIEFLDFQTPFSPILRSTVNKSRFSNPNISGIVLNLKTEDFSNDKMKFEKYFSDKNFRVFKETATKFGFMLDKHAPWRIFADMNSPAMKPYMDRHNVTPENFFGLYYDKITYPDLDLLKLYVIQMYNAYIASKPSFQEPHFALCNGRTKMRTKTTTRDKTTKEIVELQVPEEMWLRFYVFLKAREQNLGWTQTYFEQIVQKVLEFKKGLDLAAAIDYIDSKTKLPMISKRKERDFRF